MTKDTWITREGHHIEIKAMASSHLLATIHLIEKSRFTNSAEIFYTLANQDAMEYYLQWPEQYESLIAEAQRRGLIYRGIEGTTKKRIK